MPNWTSYVSEDESAKVWIDTDTNGIVKVQDLDSEEEYETAIDSSGKAELISEIGGGFRNGKIMMLIARLIEEALN